MKTCRWQAGSKVESACCRPSLDQLPSKQKETCDGDEDRRAEACPQGVLPQLPDQGPRLIAMESAMSESLGDREMWCSECHEVTTPSPEAPRSPGPRVLGSWGPSFFGGRLIKTFISNGLSQITFSTPNLSKIVLWITVSGVLGRIGVGAGSHSCPRQAQAGPGPSEPRSDMAFRSAPRTLPGASYQET